jgi:hypothetical protein
MTKRFRFEDLTMEPETITITKAEHERLIRRDCELGGLEAAGVDNWSGYGEHCEYRNELLAAHGLAED